MLNSLIENPAPLDTVTDTTLDTVTDTTLDTALDTVTDTDSPAPKKRGRPRKDPNAIVESTPSKPVFQFTNVMVTQVVNYDLVQIEADTMEEAEALLAEQLFVNTENVTAGYSLKAITSVEHDDNITEVFDYADDEDLDDDFDTEDNLADDEELPGESVPQVEEPVEVPKSSGKKSKKTA